MHGRGRIRESEYLFQLREKQKCRRILRTAREAVQADLQQGNKQRVLPVRTCALLELRIDNVVFRAGFASSRNQAVSSCVHGHVSIDGQRVTIPSYTLKKDQVVSLREKARKMIVIRHTSHARPRRSAMARPWKSPT